MAKQFDAGKAAKILRARARLAVRRGAGQRSAHADPDAGRPQHRWPQSLPIDYSTVVTLLWSSRSITCYIRCGLVTTMLRASSNGLSLSGA